MMPLRDLEPEEGRSAFGAGAANYDAARPGYPAWVYETLREHCDLKPGTATFEIGPGTGQATGELLSAGAAPLVAIEPDARLAAFMQNKFAANAALRIANASFEDAVLDEGAFGLGCAATSFHWLDERTALAKVAQLLKPGGWWAMWWNIFGDPDRHDPFHEATVDLFGGHAPGGSKPGTRKKYTGDSHDIERRLDDLRTAKAFDDIAVEKRAWTLVLDAAQTRALYASFSHLGAAPEAERERILDGLHDVAEREFGGRVERNMLTVLYTARRR